LASSTTWSSLDVSKLNEHQATEPGVYKLDGFSGGCKVVEVIIRILIFYRCLRVIWSLVWILWNWILF